ncbi:secretoglobin family 2B member 2-like [Apodemus sylvaticus]|uniref:secretoglobin family 2B member 2-like n=1 Tax=Apodemus sylvaticus TaxID=10129 RepID=UPI002241A7CC|nr:secretoglobin family 2B member 2-like [Apodemus sylvaticus]
MKGALLLLALLVIGELGFQTSEKACIPFFGIYVGLVSGNRDLLHVELSPFHPTDEEKVAFEKIQDCYEESGLKTTIQDMRLMTSILTSPECLQYYGSDIVSKIVENFPKFKAVTD